MNIIQIGLERGRKSYDRLQQLTIQELTTCI